ncbi:MAG: glycosyltransferase [Lachnospiraceae bacterium]|nr:glycosyltransferase [Lachnospiraceae bacterium]
MKISIITPFYEGNEYMPSYAAMLEQNEIALQQAGCGDTMEVILVNDSPQTAVNLPGIYNGRANWKVVKNSRNLGIQGSRVHGLQEAGGDYILFLDQDDCLREDALVRFAEAAKEHPYKVIVANAILEQAASEELWYRSDYHKKQIDNINTYLDVGIQIISPGQCLIPRMVIPDYWKEHICKENGADDYYLWLLMLEAGIGFTYLDMPLYRHHYTSVNLSADTQVTDRSVFDFITLLQEYEQFPKEYIYRLKRMIVYKANFRRGNLLQKIGVSLQNFDLFIKNLRFKMKTKTRYGFNR